MGVSESHHARQIGILRSSLRQFFPLVVGSRTKWGIVRRTVPIQRKGRSGNHTALAKYAITNEARGTTIQPEMVSAASFLLTTVTLFAYAAPNIPPSTHCPMETGTAS